MVSFSFQERFSPFQLAKPSGFQAYIPEGNLVIIIRSANLYRYIMIHPSIVRWGLHFLGQMILTSYRLGPPSLELLVSVIVLMDIFVC